MMGLNTSRLSHILERIGCNFNRFIGCGRAQTKTNIRQNIGRIFGRLQSIWQITEYLPNISPNICLRLSPIQGAL